MQLLATQAKQMCIDESVQAVPDAIIKVAMDNNGNLLYCNPHIFRGMHVHAPQNTNNASTPNILNHIKRTRAVTPTFVSGQETPAARVLS
jgi:non-ribosomal peptide synthetase component E (peptide arylation enzyme)